MAVWLPQAEIIWKKDQILPLHPNGMVFKAFDNNGRTICTIVIQHVPI
jgi:hypothetical protein